MTTTMDQPPSAPATPAAGFTPQPTPVDFSSRMSEFIETGTVADRKPAASPETAKSSAAEIPKEPTKVTEDSLGLEETGLRKASKEKPATPETPEESVGKTPKALREAYESAKKNLDTTAAEREAARKEAAELKRVLTDREKEIEAIKKEAEVAKKRVAEVSYLETDDYKDKWVTPRNEAVNRAVKEIADYTITDENGNSRKGTEEDFLEIVQASPSKALNLSKRFGDAAPDVMAMRRGIVEMIERERGHIKQQTQTWETTRAQREAELTASQKQAESIFTTRFDERTKALTESDVEGFTSAPEWVSTGKDLVSAAFKNTLNLDAGGLAKVQSEVAARAASWLPTVRLAEHLMKQLDEAKTKLAKYEQSTPNVGGNRTATQKPTDSSSKDMSARMEEWLNK